jgi:hypothetical protein
MRVTFPRLPDDQRTYALVERDDGVRYRLYGETDPFPGSRLPHDLRHLIVERELGITDGLWAGIAAGLVFRTMRYVSGRRPPRAAARSRELIAAFAAPGLRAELIADLVESVAALNHPAAAQIRRLATTKLATTKLAAAPDAGDARDAGDAGHAGDAGLDPAAIAAAATAMQVEASRWARLRVGEELCYDWPPAPRRARTARGHAARLVRSDEKENRRRAAAKVRSPAPVISGCAADGRIASMGRWTRGRLS